MSCHCIHSASHNPSPHSPHQVHISTAVVSGAVNVLEDGLVRVVQVIALNPFEFYIIWCCLSIFHCYLECFLNYDIMILQLRIETKSYCVKKSVGIGPWGLQLVLQQIFCHKENEHNSIFLKRTMIKKFYF